MGKNAATENSFSARQSDVGLNQSIVQDKDGKVSKDIDL
jgi:hypothetical protein